MASWIEKTPLYPADVQYVQVPDQGRQQVAVLLAQARSQQTPLPVPSELIPMLP